MQIFLITIFQELLINFRQMEKILANFLFFLIFISLYFLLSSGQENQGFETSAAIWISLLSCLIFSTAEFLKKDFEDGTIEQVLLSCENLEIFILAKIVANWFVSCFAALILSYFIKPESEFLILIFLGSLAINFICCFCGSLSVLGNSAPMIAVIAIPLVIPILLISCGDFFLGLKILCGLNVFLILSLTFATTKIIKIAQE
jgi:heme exporter protein B